MNDKILRIHFAYVTGILIAIIVFVASDRWTNETNFTEYLTNAATMVSLVLGLVAIFYSFISNDGLSKGLGNISTVADQVGRASEQISSFVDQAEAQARLGTENAHRMAQISEGVERNVNSLTQTLSSIVSRTTELHEIVQAFPTRFDRLESRIEESAKGVKEERMDDFIDPELPAVSQWTQIEALRFLDRSSLAMNLLTYACVLAYQGRAELSIMHLVIALEIDLSNYSNGFLNAMHAAGVLRMATVKGKEKTYRILAMDPQVVADAKVYFMDYISKEYRADPATREGWQRRMMAIERMFS